MAFRCPVSVQHFPYDKKFSVYKENAKRQPLKFSSSNAEANNIAFSLDELIVLFLKCSDTTVGLGIHYQMPKHHRLNAVHNQHL